MLTVGSKKNIFMGSWFLLALLLLAYNGMALMTLFDPELIGPSAEVRLADQKRQQLQSIEADKEIWDDDGLHFGAVLFAPPPPQPKAQPVEVATLPEETVSPPIEPEPPALPRLAGIVIEESPAGDRALSAVIEGKRHVAGDRIHDFDLVKIGEKGVTFSQNDTRWFVAAPEVDLTIVGQNRGNVVDIGGNPPSEAPEKGLPDTGEN